MAFIDPQLVPCVPCSSFPACGGLQPKGALHLWRPQHFLIFGPPSYPHLVLIYSIKFTQPSLLCLLLGVPLPHLLWMSYVYAPQPKLHCIVHAFLESILALLSRLTDWPWRVVLTWQSFHVCHLHWIWRHIRDAKISFGHGLFLETSLKRIPHTYPILDTWHVILVSGPRQTKSRKKAFSVGCVIYECCKGCVHQT